jgi:hypothetical protein
MEQARVKIRNRHPRTGTQSASEKACFGSFLVCSSPFSGMHPSVTASILALDLTVLVFEWLFYAAVKHTTQQAGQGPAKL